MLWVHSDLGTSTVEQNRPQAHNNMGVPRYLVSALLATTYKSVYPVQWSLVMDGGVIVIVQALISQVSLIPWPFIKRKGLVYSLSARVPKLLRIS